VQEAHVNFLKALPLALLVGCTTTPEGKRIDYANYADLGSTALALATDAGTEANPLGAALVPLKLGMGYWVEEHYELCWDRQRFARIVQPFYYGAAANNLAVVAGAGSSAPIVGIAAGVALWYLQPEMQCLAESDAGQLLGRAYEEGDVSYLYEAFSEDAVETSQDGTIMGREAIIEGYAEFFEASKGRKLWFMTPTLLTAEVDGRWYNYYYHFEYNEEGQITRFDYVDAPNFTDD
jgi:hypothetical protein